MAPTHPTRRTGLGRGLAEIVGSFDEAGTGSGVPSHPLIGEPDVVPIEAIPVATLLADWSGRVRGVNTRWVELSGLTAEESMGAGWLQALDRRDRPAVEAALSRIDCGAPVQSGVYRWSGHDGRAIWHVASQIQAGERVVGIAITNLPAPAPRPAPARNADVDRALSTELVEPLRTELAEPSRTELAEPSRTELAEPLRTELAALTRSLEQLAVTLSLLMARLPDLDPDLDLESTTA